MEVNFKFEIGQIVTTKLDMAEYEQVLKKVPAKDVEWIERSGRIIRPVLMYIVSRWMEECPGGMQFHYGVISRNLEQ